MLLAIDDLQWSDRPSLRFVAYLARRLEGAPVLVAATLRSGEPGTDPALLAEIAADPLRRAGAARAAERRGAVAGWSRDAARRRAGRGVRAPPAATRPAATRCCCASC